MSKSAVGLDIEDSHVWAIEISNGFEVKKMARCSVPHRWSANKTALIRKIRWLFEHYGFSRGNVIINLHGSQIITRTYKPPSIENDVFERWFVENSDALIPGAVIDDIIFDHEFLESGRVLISYAKRHAIEDHMSMLARCDIYPACIDASCLALYYAFAHHPWTREKEGFIIADIRYDHSDIIMVKDGEPCVSREAPIGSSQLSLINNDIELFTRNLATHLMKVIDYYGTKENLEITGCLLVSSDRRMHAVLRYLKQQLDIELEWGEPFRSSGTIFPVNSRPRHDGGSCYAQALGLALKGISGGSKKGINLIPGDLKWSNDQRFFINRARDLFRRCALFVMLMTLVFATASLILMTGSSGYDMQVKHLRTMKEELVMKSKQAELLANKIILIQKNNGPRFFWSRFLQGLGKALPEGVQLFRVESDVRLSVNGIAPARNLRISVEGSAGSYDSVLSFAGKVKKEYPRTRLEKIEGAEKCRFRISIEP